MATMSRVRRRPAKERLYCRDAPSAGGAEGTFAFVMSRGVENEKRGTSAIGGTRLAANRIASRLRARPLTKPSEHS
jgi:hypothetical protein